MRNGQIKAAVIAGILAVGLLGSMAQVKVTRSWAYGLFVDGSSTLPSIASATTPNSGIKFLAGSIPVIVQGGTDSAGFFGGAVQLPSTGILAWGSGAINTTSDTVLARGGAGRINITNAAQAIGSSLKVDALPVAGTCGTSPAVTAGSTPFAGSVNVGTGGTATSCTVTFGGTAFPAAPFCTLGQSAGTFTTYTATTTVLTLSAATAWPASTVVSWVCPSSK